MSQPRHFSIGLSEVALRVTDVEVSTRFYSEVVDLELDVVGEDFAFLWAGARRHQQRIILLHESLPPIHERKRVPPRPQPPEGSPFKTLAPGDLVVPHRAVQVVGEARGRPLDTCLQLAVVAVAAPSHRSV